MLKCRDAVAITNDSVLVRVDVLDRNVDQLRRHHVGLERADRREHERLVDQVAQQTAARTQLQVELDQQRSEFERRREVLRLEIEILLFQTEQQRRLDADGLVSEVTMRTAAQLESLELDIRILRKETAQAARRLDLASTRSTVVGRASRSPVRNSRSSAMNGSASSAHRK